MDNQLDLTNPDYEAGHYTVIGNNSVELFRYACHEHGLDYKTTFYAMHMGGATWCVYFLKGVPGEVQERLQEILSRYIPMYCVNSDGFRETIKVFTKGDVQ